jgi:hypothetical protein
LFNKGSFPKSNSIENISINEVLPLKKSEESSKSETTKSDKVDFSNQDDVEKIVVFYKNGTFKTYLPK